MISAHLISSTVGQLYCERYCHFYNDQEIWNLDGAISLCSDGYTLKNVCDNGEYTILIMVKSLCKK